MKFNRASVVLVFCLIATTAVADKGDKFMINVHGRFYMEAVPYLNKGLELREKGDLQGARQCFDRAIQIDKGIWPAYLDRAEIFAEQRHWDLALQDCNTAAHLRPDFYRTFIVRAGIYAALGKCRDGLADLDRVLSFHGDAETNAVAFTQRARLRLMCRDPSIHDPKLALADAKQACDLIAGSKASYLGTLAAAYAANGNFDEAIRYEQQAIKSGKYSAEELHQAQERLSRYQKHQKQQ
jgi:tetratricopeptide (TPR) repeat protein